MKKLTFFATLLLICFFNNATFANDSISQNNDSISQNNEIIIENISNSIWELAYSNDKNTLNDAIERMFDYQISEFNSESNYRANDYVTREESAKMFMKFYVNILWKESPTIKNYGIFSDIWETNPKLADFALEANMIWIFNWIKHKFLPKNNIKQSQAIAVVIRFLDWNLDSEKWFWFKNYVEKAKQYWILEWLDFWSNSEINKNYITRWQLALLLYNTFIFKKWWFATENVINYNNNLVDILDLCLHDKDIFVSLDLKWNHKNMKLITEINRCNIALKQINKLEAWNDDSSLKDSVKNVIIDVIDIYNKLLEKYKNHNQWEFNELIEINSTLSKDVDLMIEAQLSFSNKYWYDLD